MEIAETPEKLIRLMDGDKKSDITCFHEEFEKFVALVPSWRAAERFDDFKVGEKRKGSTEVNFVPFLESTNWYKCKECSSSAETNFWAMFSARCCGSGKLSDCSGYWM